MLFGKKVQQRISGVHQVSVASDPGYYIFGYISLNYMGCHYITAVYMVTVRMKGVRKQ